MSVAARVIAELRDARVLGWRFPARHLARRHEKIRVPIKGVGTVSIRPKGSDAVVFRQVFTDRQYELRRLAQWPDIDAAFRRVVRDGRTPLIIDAGANNGASALWFAREFPSARIVAVEPSAPSAALCRENTFGLDVDVLEMALGGEPGRVDVVSDGRWSWRIATTREEGGEVEICTVPEIMRAHEPDCDLFLVKIDIEGFESDVFAANTEWVSATKVLIIEPHDWMLPGQRTSRGFQSTMAALDFDLVISGENLVYVRRDG